MARAYLRQAVRCSRSLARPSSVIVLGRRPLGFHQSLTVQPVQRLVQRAILDDQGTAGIFVDT